MNRRTVLASASVCLAGGVSGCLGGLRSGGDDEPEVRMRLSVTGVGDGPGPLAFRVDVVDDRLTASTVPVVDITMTNTGDEQVKWLHTSTGVGSISEIVFPPTETMPDKLTLELEEEVTGQLVGDEDCARTEDGIRRGQAPHDAWIGAGEVFGQRYAIAGNDQKLMGSCPPKTSYRARDNYGGVGTWSFRFELLPWKE